MTELMIHRLLLAFADRLPTPLLGAARLALAESPIDAASLLSAVVALGRTPVTADEWNQLVALAEPSEEENDDAPWIVDELPRGAHTFAALSGTGPSGQDELDIAVIRAAEDGGRVVGLWRCWRADGFAEEPEVRVYLAQVESEQDAPAAAARLYRACQETQPGAETAVEAVTVDDELGPYQRQALDAALLLWADVEAAGPEFRLAPVYDWVDPQQGPGFTDDHPLIADMVLRTRLLEYLAAGRPVLSTTARMVDPLDPTAGEVVPLGFLTDGEWIWTEAVGYLLERYGIEPNPELLAHIRLFDFVSPEPDQDAVLRASAFVLAPPADGAPAAVWTTDRT